MKRIFFVICILVFLAGMTYSQSITVTNPKSNSVWNTGTEYTILWDKAGKQPARVKIRLYNSTGTTKILAISDDTPNDQTHPWTVPGSVAPGKYVIRVKTLDNAVFDDSEVFTITKSSQIGRVNYKRINMITFLSPTGGNYATGQKLPISWQTSWKVGSNDIFFLELYSGSGKRYKRAISTIKADSTRFNWIIPNDVRPEFYTIKVSYQKYQIVSQVGSTPKRVSGLSGRFRISTSTGVKKYKVYPSTINMYKVKRWRSNNKVFLLNKSPKADPGNGRMRTGYENYFTDFGEAGDTYVGFVYRSHALFNIKGFSGKGIILKARLHFNKYQGKNCGIKIYKINKSWSSLFKVDVERILNSSEWTSIVQKWVAFPNSNYGLLFTGTNENFSHNKNKCVALCKNIYLEIELLEKK